MSLGPFRTCILAREGCVEMRGRRSNEGGRIASEFDNWGDGRCMACPGKRVGRVEERMLYSLGFLSAGL